MRAPLKIRPATAADNEALCALFAETTMDAELVLSVHREPDFFALYRMQSREWECWVAEVEGRIEAMATILVREGYLHGERRRIGYLGDLRISPRGEGRHLLNRVMGPILRAASGRFGCDVYLTAIIASNQKALRALTVENRRSAGRPRYTPLRDFRIRSLHLTWPRLRKRTPYSVRPATAADLPALERFLDDDARRRPFGYAFGAGELERRMAEWPGLEARSFYLAEDAGGLAGCFALWDAAPVKRMVAVEYRGGMRRVKRGYDLAARIFRFPALPDPGAAFRYLYVTHQAIPSGDPRVLRALLDAAYADLRGSGYQFLSLFAPEGDPLEPAFRGFQTTDLHARLMMVTPPGVPAPVVGDERPGFEMALV
ncbi:MAG TPA: hypothetical protein VF613_21125 [Longimicrobium sp.]